jgi:hypothetical protein
VCACAVESSEIPEFIKQQTSLSSVTFDAPKWLSSTFYHLTDIATALLRHNPKLTELSFPGQIEVRTTPLAFQRLDIQVDSFKLIPLGDIRTWDSYQAIG